MAVGNGGFGGSIQGFGEMQTALRLGYATAGSDTGHDEATEGSGGMFALGHPPKIVDFAYRAVHEMTATSKKSWTATTAARRSSRISRAAPLAAGRR